jgi:hypothetical protein
MKSGGSLAKEMRQGQAPQLAAFQRSPPEQQTQGSTLIALVLFHFITLAFVSLAEEMRQGQAPQLAAFQRSPSEQHAQSSTVIALVLFHFVILAFVSFAEEMGQGQAPQLTAPQRSSPEQHAKRLPFRPLPFGHRQCRLPDEADLPAEGGACAAAAASGHRAAYGELVARRFHPRFRP